MNSRRSRRPRTGRTSSDTRPHPICRPPSTSSRRSAVTSAPSSCAPPARPTCCPTSGRLESPAAPVVTMEGAERIMLGSNNYLGLTGDERVIAGARDALERYGTGLTGSRLLNGTIELHLELERELAEWMGTEEAIVFTTGHQANVGTLGTILAPGDTVIADSADHASILDGCLLSRAKLRPFRHGRLDKLEKMLAARRRRRRRRARGRRRRVLDGGRRRRPAADRRAVQGARRAADGRRGARGRRARRARRRRVASCSASRPTSTCGWARSRSRSPAAAASSPARTR